MAGFLPVNVECFHTRSPDGAFGEWSSKRFPLPFHGLGHVLGGGSKPGGFPAAQVRKDAVEASVTSQVYVGRLRAHRVEERVFVAFLWQVGNLDRIQIRQETPDNPRAADGLNRVAGAAGSRHCALIERLPVADFSPEPGAR